MGSVITWTPGMPCQNCGGPMKLVPLPRRDQRIAAEPGPNYTPLPQTVDTRPAHQIEDEGRLYRCDPCDSKVVTKDPPPPDLVTDAHARIDALASRVGVLADQIGAVKAAHDATTARVDDLAQSAAGKAAPPPSTSGE